MCDCGHAMSEHQTGVGPWTGWCGGDDTECECVLTGPVEESETATATSGDGHAYSRRDAVQFVRDMEAAGLEVWHYRGRFYWEGPAVTVDDLQKALYATKVPCQWDSMGRDWVVYPKSGDPGVEARA
jgi:hypothetical protein